MENDNDIEFVEENSEECVKKIKTLKEQLRATQKEKEEYLAGWQRAKADFINARNDEEKNRAEFVKFAGESVIRDFLELADSISMAKNHGFSEADILLGQLYEILKRYGAEPAENSIGKPFDPANHEAIEQVPTDQKDDGMIVEESQSGYRMNGKVLRPAKVKVGVYQPVH